MRLDLIEPSKTSQQLDFIRNFPAWTKDRESGVIDFTIGQPDQYLDDEILDVSQLEKRSVWGYSPRRGFPELIAEIMRCYNDGPMARGPIKTPIIPDDILLGPGCKALLYYFFCSQLKQGDRVMLVEPCWTSYRAQILAAGGTPVSLKLKMVPQSITAGSGLTKVRLALPRADIMEQAANSEVLVIGTPGNPHGEALDEEELYFLVHLLHSCPHLKLVVDEIYADIVQEWPLEGSGLFGRSVIEAFPDDLLHRVFIFNGFSKSTAIAGARLGFCIAPRNPEAMDGMLKLHDAISSCAPAIVQQVALKAIRSFQRDEEKIERLRDTYTQRRELLLSILSTTTGGPWPYTADGMYVYLFLPGTADLDGRVKELFEATRVAGVNADAFGKGVEPAIRLSLGTVPDLEMIRDGASRLAKYLSS